MKSFLEKIVKEYGENTIVQTLQCESNGNK